MKYRLCITEYLTKTIEVDAENFIEAYEEVRRMYRNEEVVLSADDFSHCDIQFLDEEDQDGHKVY